MFKWFHVPSFARFFVLQFSPFIIGKCFLVLYFILSLSHIYIVRVNLGVSFRQHFLIPLPFITKFRQIIVTEKNEPFLWQGSVNKVSGFHFVSSRSCRPGAGIDEDHLHWIWPESPTGSQHRRQGGGPGGDDPLLLRGTGEQIHPFLQTLLIISVPCNFS